MTRGNTHDPAHASAPGIAARSLATSPWAVAGILVMVLLVHLVLASSTTLWDRDEPRFARAAVEMVDSGDYLVPRFNGNLRPDKPALIYWLMAVPLRAMGVSELAVRLPSIVGILVATLFTYLIGRRLFDARVGLQAMIFYASAVLVIAIGGLATADGTLNAFTTVAIWAFVEWLHRRDRFWPPLALAFALGGAQLAKGPVGLAIPLLTILGTNFMLERERRLSGRMWAMIAVASGAGVALFLAWALPANAATGGELGRVGIGRHVVERILRPQEGHGGSGVLGYLATLPLYVPLLIAGIFPWVVHLPGAISAVVRRHVGGPLQRAVLVGWAAPTFLLMSLVATKLPHYILPIFPALAIGMAATLAAHRRGELSDKDRAWLRGGVWLFTPVAALIVVGLVGVGWFIDAPALRWAGPLAATPLIIATALVLRWQLHERTGRTSAALAAATPVTILLLAQLVMPGIETIKVSPEVAAAARAEAGDDAAIYFSGYSEPSLIFYLNQSADRPVRELGGTAEDYAAWRDAPGRAVVVMSRQRLDNVQRQIGDMRLREVFSSRALNYAKRGQQHEVLVLVRDGSRSDPVPVQSSAGAR